MRPRGPLLQGSAHLLAQLAGGITPSTIPNVLAQTPAPLAGGGYRHLDGLAVVSSISAATDPFTAATELRALFLGRKMLPSWSTNASTASVNEQQLVGNAVDMLKLLRDGAHKPLVHHITVRPSLPLVAVTVAHAARSSRRTRSS